MRVSVKLLWGYVNEAEIQETAEPPSASIMSSLSCSDLWPRSGKWKPDEAGEGLLREGLFHGTQTGGEVRYN